MDYILGWMLKIATVAIILSLIVKLFLISINKDKMKAFEDTLSKNKSNLIIWFFPAVFCLFALSMTIGMYSDDLISNDKPIQIKKFDNTDKPLEGVEKRLACSLPGAKDKCDQ